MPTPFTNRPKIVKQDILNGYVTRYFVKFISQSKIIEVDNAQYTTFITNPLYETLELKWVIGGNSSDITVAGGNVIYGAAHRNQVTIDFYNNKFSGLNTLLVNPLEYFMGVDNSKVQ